MRLSIGHVYGIGTLKEGAPEESSKMLSSKLCSTSYLVKGDSWDGVVAWDWYLTAVNCILPSNWVTGDGWLEFE